MSRPELGELLQAECNRLLLSPATSLEVRKRLEALGRGRSAAGLSVPDQVGPEEIDRLIAQLDHDSFAVRLGASKRLGWLLEDPRLVCPILTRLKQRMEAEPLSADARQWLEPIYNQARRQWLISDPATWQLPPVSQEQMLRWVDELVRPARGPGAPADRTAGQRAFRELRDLLARSDCAPIVQSQLQARLRQNRLDAEAARRVSELLELTRPEMVAECWLAGRVFLPAQRLRIGVPSLGPGAERPSHFDRIDDQVAHCVSGQNLAPGDYPVGVAIPHPKQPGTFFHLVNLSTPRHKMLYELISQQSPQRRLADISRRTCQRWLALKRPLELAELGVLGQLDPRELSRFASKFVELVDDRPLPPSATEGPNLAVWQSMLPAPGRGPNLPTAPASHHAWIGAILAAKGTQEAVPGLLRAIQANRFLPPTPDAPERMEWTAALAIAQRDPWPGVDAWLAASAQRIEGLILGLEHGPQVGATAATILLARHGQQPTEFGIRPATEPPLAWGELTGYRYISAEGPARVQRWWSAHKARLQQPLVRP
ncbi:MAG: hypothetical protein ACUVUC_06050 [Thermoguttaceae bacterium]